MKISYPKPEELYAIEAEARRVRAEELARLLRAGAAAVKSLFGRVGAVAASKEARHA
jgi:hypothetical protein